jgi:8-oxo-dGTP pyrophosphatase MutT (NUDIX family)
MEKSCGAVVFREEGAGQRLYLLLAHSKGHWDLPKGHVEKGETEEQTARREINEETGVTDIEFLEGFRHTIAYTYLFRGRKMPKEVTFFIAKTRQPDVKMSDEHIGFEWLPFRKAAARITYSNARRVLEAAEAYLSSQEAVRKGA